MNRLAAMVRRHYSKPARVICVTDEPEGIDTATVEIVPAWNDFADVKSPHGAGMPACYRRLRAFDPDIGDVFGPRFVSIDLDVVLVADVTPLWDRPEEFVGYRDPLYPHQLNGSMWLLTAGARPDVWNSFDPNRSPQIARGARFFGSDQAWLSLRLPGEAQWDARDGVYSFRKDIVPKRPPYALPKDARLIVCHGQHDPWDETMQRLPWIREHWGTITCPP